MNKIKRCYIPSSFLTKMLCFVILALFLMPFRGLAQYGVSALYTDYKGYWTSAYGAINSVQPDNKHNLLFFKWNGVNYSTGVNDILLATKISFTPGTYQAFPVKDIPLPGTSSNFVGLGQLEDGVDNGGVYPYSVPVTVSQILTRGTRGLDMGSCITNIPATSQPLSFNFGAIADDSQIGDGIPDILITQVAQATGALDEVYFEDINGVLVGNKISIDQSAINSIGNWLSDFYNPNTGVIQAGFIKTERPIRIWAADASAFGITSFNYQKPLVLRYKLGGSSDPAFLAFNTKFITLVSANDDQAATTLGVPVVIDVLSNDVPNSQSSLSSYTVPATSAHGTILKNANGTLTYTPAAGYYGQDTFTYSICTNIDGTVTCDDAIVTINISPDVVAPVFSSGVNNRCQGGSSTSYTTSSAFATSMAFAVSPNTAGTVTTSAMTTSSNVGTATGTVVWASDFYGTATITAIAYGANGPKSSTYSATDNQAPTLTTSGNIQDVCAGTPISSTTASVTGKTPAGADVTDISGTTESNDTISGTTESNDTPTVAAITPTGLLTLVKTVNGAVPTTVGEVLNYDLVIKNTGNVTLTNLVVTDVNAIVSGSPVSTLAPGASVTLTASHTLTQVDVDAGAYSNTASVTGKIPAGADVIDISGTTESNDTPTVAAITEKGALTLVKTIKGTVPVIAGGILYYDLTIKNTGNVTLTNLVLTDTNAVLSGSQITSLLPGANVTITASHVLTQEDVNSGTYINSASITGKTPSGKNVNDISGTNELNDDPTIANILPDPSVRFTKMIANSAGVVKVIEYSIQVTNTGKVTLTDIVVTDPGTDAGSIRPSIISKLDPAETALVTARHTLIQPEIDYGKFVNQASLVANYCGGANKLSQLSDDPITLAPNDPTVYLIPEHPAITLLKTGLLSSDGNTITYTFTAKNTGNVTLNNFQLADAKLSTTVVFSPMDIAPGASAYATAVYTITQAEKNAGMVINSATISAHTPSGTTTRDVSGTAEDNDYPTIIEVSKMTASKSVLDDNHNGIAEAGEVLTYKILVRNNGNTDRTGVAISDAIPLNTVYVNSSASAGAVFSGNVLSWNNITVPARSEAEVIFKVQVNSVIPSGELAINNTALITDPGNANTILKPFVSIPTAGKLEGGKSVADTKGNNDGRAQANEILTYSLTVRNTGGSALNGVIITDELPAGLSYVQGSISGYGTASNNTLRWTLNMQANSSTTLTFDAKVAPDVNQYNIIRNVATMVSQSGVSIQPDASIDVDKSADLVITKELLNTGDILTGADVTYKITVTNKGANRATGVVVTDRIPTIIDKPKDIVVSVGSTSYSATTRDFVWLVGSLDLNQTATITFKSRTLASGPLSNSATVKAAQPDPIAANNYVLADGATINGDDLLIPNLFTPNGDGRNDTFEIRGLTEFAENGVTIVNRWGNQVYRAKNYLNNWSGGGLNEGTYYYLVRVRKSGSTTWKVFSGYITLIRAFKN